MIDFFYIGVNRLLFGILLLGKPFLASILFLSLLIAGCTSSPEGTLHVNVSDLEGEALDQAQVSVYSGDYLEATGASSGGTASFDLTPGVYQLVVSKQGYEPANKNLVVVPEQQNQSSLKIKQLKTSDSAPSYYVVDDWGGIHNTGDAPIFTNAPYRPEEEFVRDFELFYDQFGTVTGYYVLGSDGRIYSLGNASPFSPGSEVGEGEPLDIELTPDQGGMYILSRTGEVASVGNAPVFDGALTPGAIPIDLELYIEGTQVLGYYVLSSDGSVGSFGAAKIFKAPKAVTVGRPVDLEVTYGIREDGGLSFQGYYVLDSFGLVYSFGDVPLYDGDNFGWDIARKIKTVPGVDGFVVMDGFGGVHFYGDLVLNTSETPYWPGADISADLEIIGSRRPLSLLSGYCSDRTRVESCSAQQPFYCSSSGFLAQDCSRCGCPADRPVCSASGFCEEIFFRGLLLPKIGIILSSLAFGLLHLPGRRFWIYALWASLSGALFGFLFLTFNSLWIPITAHATNNIIGMMLLKRLEK